MKSSYDSRTLEKCTWNTNWCHTKVEYFRKTWTSEEEVKNWNWCSETCHIWIWTTFRTALDHCTCIMRPSCTFPAGIPEDVNLLLVYTVIAGGVLGFPEIRKVPHRKNAPHISIHVFRLLIVSTALLWCFAWLLVLCLDTILNGFDCHLFFLTHSICSPFVTDEALFNQAASNAVQSAAREGCLFDFALARERLRAHIMEADSRLATYVLCRLSQDIAESCSALTKMHCWYELSAYWHNMCCYLDVL